MPSTLHRRQWIKQSGLAALAAGFSFRSIAGEDQLPRSFGNDLGLINLGSNENPYGISKASKAAIQEFLPFANRYSYNLPTIRSFREKLAQHYGLAAENLIVTAGSGEALVLLARHLAPKGALVSAFPTFPTLPTIYKKSGGALIDVPLTSGKVHDLPAMLQAMTPQTKAVYLVNPANPTSTMLKPAVIKDFIGEASKNAMVVIDEAYIDYLEAPDDESMISLIATNPNIIVVRTFSKIHGMAGLRVGFVCAHPNTIKKLEDAEFSHSERCLSVLAMNAALASLKDPEHSKMSREKNAAARNYTKAELQKLGYDPVPSSTNFLFFSLKNYSGDFAKAMLEKNIVLRSSDYSDGKYCRVSIGTLSEMQQFIQVMKKDFSS